MVKPQGNPERDFTVAFPETLKYSNSDHWAQMNSHNYAAFDSAFGQDQPLATPFYSTLTLTVPPNGRFSRDRFYDVYAVITDAEDPNMSDDSSGWDSVEAVEL